VAAGWKNKTMFHKLSVHYDMSAKICIAEYEVKGAGRGKSASQRTKSVGTYPGCGKMVSRREVRQSFPRHESLAKSYSLNW
jgi:hypothetical protein